MFSGHWTPSIKATASLISPHSQEEVYAEIRKHDWPKGGFLFPRDEKVFQRQERRAQKSGDTFYNRGGASLNMDDKTVRRRAEKRLLDAYEEGAINCSWLRLHSLPRSLLRPTGRLVVSSGCRAPPEWPLRPSTGGWIAADARAKSG